MATTTMKKPLRLLRGMVMVLLVLAIWWVLGRFSFATPKILPTPFEVVKALARIIRTAFWGDFSATVSRILVAFTASIFAGRWLGLWTGTSRICRDLFEPVLQGLRPIPALALIPVLIVWFGTGEIEKYAVVFWAAFFPIWIGTHVGVQTVPRELIWTAQTLGANAQRIRKDVIARAAADAIFGATRTGLGLAFAAAVVAEMVGSSEGLGYRIIEGNQAYQYDQMIAAILIVGIIGAVTDWAYKRAFQPKVAALWEHDSR